MADEKNGQKALPPPYLPYRTFKNYLEGLRASGVPAKIDRSVLRNRSGTEQTMLLNTLQYLGLTGSDGTPNYTLADLVSQAEESVRRKVLSDLLTSRYSFLFGSDFNLQTATPAMIHDAFDKAGLSGDTTRKAVAFFLTAAQDAQIPISPFLKVRPGRPAGGQRRRMRAGQPNGTDSAAASAITPPSGVLQLSPGQPKSHYQMLIDILDPSMEKEEQEAVWTLIRYLKRQETQ